MVMEPRTASQVLGLTLKDRYHVAEPISAGAMGAVYRAVDAETGRRWRSSSRRTPSTTLDSRPRRGCSSSLQHPRVVRILDHFTEKSGQYLVMELVKGIELGRLLKQRGDPGLPVEQATEYVRHACEALQYVHEQQIVHRDVKPQNLILGEQGVVLVDFGIARLMDEDEQQGTVGIGTPRFMAPEVLAGGSVSPRTDVFGVAATLWTLIAGRAPRYADPTALSTIAPAVTPELERTIAAGLEMIPERRVASIAAFAKALGAPLQTDSGISLAVSLDDPDTSRSLMEAIVHTAAGVFGAAAASICLTDETTGELVYQSAWGAGAREIVGVRLPPGRRALRHGRADRDRRRRPELPDRSPVRGRHRGRDRVRPSHDARRAAAARHARRSAPSRSSTAATAAATARRTSSRPACSGRSRSRRSTPLRARSPASASARRGAPGKADPHAHWDGARRVRGTV